MATDTNITDGWRRDVQVSCGDLMALAAAGGEPRAVARFGPVTCADLGVPHGWGLHASYDDTPERHDREAALAWLRYRAAGRRWELSMPRSHAAQGLWDPLVEVGSKPVYAMGVEAAVGMARELPRALVVTTTPSRDEVVAAYGGWMDDLPLAEQLVTDDDLVQPRRRVVCGLVDGRAIGCAFLRWSERTAYLSGIGVLAAERGRGYGWALTAEAARVAVEHAPYGRPDVVWMYATDEGAALYSRMGFERIDDHVSLSDA